jgi:UDP-N-acetylmuramoyl-L-alanyl-D-glutamate--2,6-diaminopimelate ligase
MTPKRSYAVADLATACGDLLSEVTGDGSVEIDSLAYDSRKAGTGCLFFCVVGARADGHDYAAVAVDAGASALVVERNLDVSVPQVIVSDVRRCIGRMAARFFGDPASKLTLLGVTGTNGKTTTAYLLESILEASGATTGLIGTIETRVAGEKKPGIRTTPDSLELQELFAEMVEAGVDSVAMEVTSHALVLHRIEGVRFAAAAFTNLTQDHLDFHTDMEDYFRAKRSLFVAEHADSGAANVDDPFGRRLVEGSEIDMMSFGASDDASVRASGVSLLPRGTDITMETPRGTLQVSTGLVGGFNVSNCLGACATALQAGIGLEDIATGLSSAGSVPGRFESIDEGQSFTVVVDYAHTPDSLDNVLREARRLADVERGRVLVVFGCGGDRDRGKRPLMGAAAARLADVVLVTSDNPRSEPPLEIIGEILAGVDSQRPDGADVVTEDRSKAIGEAIGRAGAGDVVVIAGKGHESGQTFADRTIPFDDRDVAREWLRGGGG